ncbi:hypothetical protein ABBQ38_000277 [Trebouxia sp. C0009 RCD-2024]
MAEETQPLQPQQAPPTQPQQPAPQNAIMAVGSNLKNFASNVLKERKPWTEMVDRSSFARPTNLADATGRLRKNALYFKVNYLVVILTITAVTMALYPTSLIVLGCLALAWLYLFVVRQSPLVIGGRTFNNNEKFIGMAVISGIIIFFLTSVGTVLFTALGISCAAIGVHGALRQPDDLFTDEAESQQGGIFGLFGGASQSNTGHNIV